MAGRHGSFLHCLIPLNVFRSKLCLSPVAAGVVPTKALQDVVIMFCHLEIHLPDVSHNAGLGAGSSTGAGRSTKDLFGFLNHVFAAFDDSVRQIGLYKYHHIAQTYVVTSAHAALVERPSDWSVHSDICDMLLLARRFETIAAKFQVGQGGEVGGGWGAMTTSLKFGMDVGNLSGGVVGKRL